MLLIVLTSSLERREREAIAYLMEENLLENLLLRRQLGRRRLRLTDDDRRRLVRAFRLGRQALRQIAAIVTPETLKPCNRQLIGRIWTYSGRLDNRTLFENSRRAAAGWPDTDDGHARACRVAIYDRDRTWTHDPRRLLEDAGIHVVQTPRRAPNAHASAERFVPSIKEKCLNRIIPIGERHFRRSVAEFVAYDHRERNHQGLAIQLIVASPAISAIGRVHRCTGLGGIPHHLAEPRSRGALVMRWGQYGLVVNDSRL